MFSNSVHHLATESLLLFSRLQVGDVMNYIHNYNMYFSMVVYLSLKTASCRPSRSDDIVYLSVDVFDIAFSTSSLKRFLTASILALEAEIIPPNVSNPYLITIDIYDYMDHRLKHQ